MVDIQNTAKRTLKEIKDAKESMENSVLGYTITSTGERVSPIINWELVANAVLKISYTKGYIDNTKKNLTPNSACASIKAINEFEQQSEEYCKMLLPLSQCNNVQLSSKCILQ